MFEFKCVYCVISLEDEALAGVVQSAGDELLVEGEGGEGGVVSQAAGRDVDGGLAPALQN